MELTRAHVPVERRNLNNVNLIGRLGDHANENIVINSSKIIKKLIIKKIKKWWSLIKKHCSISKSSSFSDSIGFMNYYDLVRFKSSI